MGSTNLEPKRFGPEAVPNERDRTAAARELNDAAGAASFLEQLFERGLLIPSDVDGLYGRGAVFEDVIERISDLIGAWGVERGADVMRFPPAMSRTLLEQSGYLKNFPQLAGTVFSFCGNDFSHPRLLACLDKGEDWTAEQKPTCIMMTPVACYPVYSVMAKRGPVPAQGHLIDIFSYVFRQEPSLEPERMQLFRQREFVRMGTPEQVIAFRQNWMDHARWMFDALELPMSLELANDPFFGRGGRVMANSQRALQLKFEAAVTVLNPNKPTACGSFNYHMDNFGKTWDIRTETGEIAHTGCCGFGLERIALSLFKLHGFDIAAWPRRVRQTLWKPPCGQ
ncbi:amino acid--[acyl-carrier-protein] ligase [Mycetohabitans sp. B8]|uniref:amino acid--[acyl-carrier-protein] ligase n=1 Tax=Mycetohabitans sp. B8 TaxID=2841845 RepID=UPI001F3BB6BD|nr:amino acid--[acyl-carrier-protein] ligase [Mycetohabitans sp. B8]MCG1042552.1 amino acid--[acyl-carrier-protein] ligase [Mycetohabitans sp. B8]